MRGIRFFFFFTLVPFLIYSQSARFISPGKVFVTAAPFSLLDYIEGFNLNLGVMVNNQDKQSLTNEFGYLIPCNYSRGFKDRITFKYYLVKMNSDKEKYYVGLQYQYKNSYISLSKRYRDSLKPDANFTLHKKAHSILALFGKETLALNSLYIDTFIGLGYRQRNMNVIGLEPGELPYNEYIIDAEDPDFLAPFRDVGKSNTVDFVIGFRLIVKLL
jgi:hypothetical protein